MALADGTPDGAPLLTYPYGTSVHGLGAVQLISLFLYQIISPSHFHGRTNVLSGTPFGRQETKTSAGVRYLPTEERLVAHPRGRNTQANRHPLTFLLSALYVRLTLSAIPTSRDGHWDSHVPPSTFSKQVTGRPSLGTDVRTVSTGTTAVHMSSLKWSVHLSCHLDIHSNARSPSDVLRNSPFSPQLPLTN